MLLGSGSGCQKDIKEAVCKYGHNFAVGLLALLSTRSPDRLANLNFSGNLGLGKLQEEQTAVGVLVA